MNINTLIERLTVFRDMAPQFGDYTVRVFDVDSLEWHPITGFISTSKPKVVDLYCDEA